MLYWTDLIIVVLKRSWLDEIYSQIYEFFHVLVKFMFFLSLVIPPQSPTSSLSTARRNSSFSLTNMSKSDDVSNPNTNINECVLRLVIIVQAHFRDIQPDMKMFVRVESMYTVHALLSDEHLGWIVDIESLVLFPEMAPFWRF